MDNMQTYASPFALNLDRSREPQLTADDMALMNVPSWKRVMWESKQLIDRGLDARLALNHLRPCADSPIRQIAVNATLRRDEWELMDETVTAAAQETLTAVDDVLSRGLRLNLTDPFGTPIVTSERVGEMSAAQVAMYAGTPPQDDRVSYDLWGVPVPVISKGFWLDERVLAASRRGGSNLDTTNADAATRVVSEKMEEIMFTGGGVSYGGYTLYGLTNHPNVNVGSLSASWATLASTNPGAIASDIITMKAALAADYATGPYLLYIPRAWIDLLDHGYFETTAASPAAVTGMIAPQQTVRQHILGMSDIEAIRPTSQLTTGVVLVSMRRNVIDIAWGFAPRLISWTMQAGMTSHFRVLAVMAPRIKADINGRSGIAYFTV